MIRIAVLDDWLGVADRYASWGHLHAAEVVTFRDHVGDQNELCAMLEPFDVVVVMRERTALPRDVLSRLPKLRLLVTTGMKNAAVDLEAASQQGLTVCGTDSDVSGTVEMTWALMLAVRRNLVVEANSMRAGGWQKTMGQDLKDTTLGLVGLGRIGSRVAEIGQAFGMRVLAWSANLVADVAARHGVELAPSLHDLLGRSDVVSLHVRLSDRTRGMIGSTELAQMKSGSILINTSRGPLVDTNAVVEALDSGSIAGLGQDTYDLEPLPTDAPLRSAPNTVLTPHIGYSTARTFTTYFQQIVEDVKSWQNGSPVRVLTPGG